MTTLSKAVVYNLKRGAARAKLFEIGHAFRRSDEGVEEVERLALAAAGDRLPLDWSRPNPPPYDLFDLKGDVEDVLAATAGLTPVFRAGARGWLHPGRQAEIAQEDGTPLGFCGEVHPSLAEAWGADGRLYVAEIDLAAVPAEADEPRVEAWSREPAVERDLALVVPDGDPAAEVLAAVRAAGLEHLARVRVFDRYAGAQVPAGHHSLGLRLTFEADRTLTDEEVDAEVERVLARLREERGYGLR